MLSSTANLLFGDLDSYDGFNKTFFNIFGTGLGNYDFEEFNDGILPVMVGKIFVFISVILNAIILFNFIIAVLSATYTDLDSKSQGLYYDGIIARIPVYEDDRRFGGLILATTPLNILSILLIPIFCCCRKDEKQAISINDVFTKIVFAPIALCSVAVFAAFSLVMVPFAYLKALVDKIRILRVQSVEEDNKEKVSKRSKYLKQIRNK